MSTAAGIATQAPRRPGEARPVFEPWKDPTRTPLIRFEGVTKRFGDFTAVDDLTLDVHEREFFALLGPSGCGKTTLMRMLAGFEEPSAGRILLGGEDMAGIPPHRRPVNMMFQSYALFPHLSVADNIGFGLKRAGMAKAEREARVADMLRLVRLEGFGRRKPHQLSGGQRQRVALARSLALRPKVLLLDEPLAALDRKLRDETRYELSEIQSNLGTTFLVVTHDQEEAMTLADRMAVMNAGRILQVAPPAEIYEQPNCRYVADFIGDVNILPGRVREMGDGTVLLDSDLSATPFVVASAAELPAGAEAWLAVRPEKIALSTEQPLEATHNQLTGIVADIGYLGDLSLYRVRLDDGTTVRVSVTNLTRMVDRRITWDDRVYLSWAPKAGVLLAR